MRNRLHLARGLMGCAAALAVAHPGAAQLTEPVTMKVGTDSVIVTVRRDTLGILPAPGADSLELATYLDGQGYGVHVLPHGVWLARIPVPLATGSEVVAVGRALRQARPDLVAEAGPLGRFPGWPAPVFYPDRIMVWYRSGVGGAGRTALESLLGLERLRSDSRDPDLVLYRLTDATPQGYFETFAVLDAQPSVERSYPDYAGGVLDALVPSDTYYGLQWHLGGGGPGSIDAEGAWNVTTGNSGTIIAVVEQFGIQSTHPDLADNRWIDSSNPSAPGWDFGSCTATQCPVPNFNAYPDVSHGTMVTGLAAAKGNNGQGVAGVCFDCRFLPLATGGQLSGRREAFLWAEAQGAAVINASWTMQYDPQMALVLRQVALDSRGGQGVPVIFAAGNDNAEICNTSTPHLGADPAAYLVGASDRSDKATTWSNYGSCLDLVAPGGSQDSLTSVVSTDPTGNTMYNPRAVQWNHCTSEIAGTMDYTRCGGGTSASAPIVAGTVGLMLSVNPALETEEVYEILDRTARKVSCADALYGGSAACPTDWRARSDRYGYGRLDAAAAVQEASNARDQVPESQGPDAGVGGGNVEVGSRLGYTRLQGPAGRDVWNVPGSGPRAEPVLHLGVVTDGPGVTRFLWEAQVGRSRATRPAPADPEERLALAAQGAILWPLGGYSAYAGINAALFRHDDGLGTVVTPTAWGGAVGLRRVLFGYLPIRIEVRWRSWSDGTDETGVAAVLGVLF